MTARKHAEQARALVASGRWGTLSTISRKQPGWPFGSMMPYAPDRRGRPVLLLSAMAAHTRNLAEDPRASLLVVQTAAGMDPLDCPRVTLLGTVSQVAPAEIGEARRLYLEAHPNAGQWADFADFTFYRLETIDLHFIGGFGAISWISAEEYFQA